MKSSDDFHRCYSMCCTVQYSIKSQQSLPVIFYYPIQQLTEVTARDHLMWRIHIGQQKREGLLLN